MKKILLASFLFAALFTSRVNAQAILNAGFETWVEDTAYFDGFNGFLPLDTFAFTDPENWTTTNALTGAEALGHYFFVNEETISTHGGNSALKLTTDTLKTITINPLGDRQLTIPGLAVNGKFPLDLQGSLVGGGAISPAAIPGSGQPWAKRLASIKGFYDYVPVFNDSLGHIDSCIVWAILRKGEKVVAEAKFTSGATTGGYQPFTANFQYLACDNPDTLVILIAASIPSLGNVLTGTTQLVRGSVLFVDDLDFDTLAANYNYPPIAKNDTVTNAVKNTPYDVLVKANDTDCNDAVSGLTMAVSVQPLHGSAAVVSTTHITYTPANNFVGVDTFFYTITDGVGTSTGMVRLFVLNSSGISNVNQVPVVVYPVPASNQLNVQFDYNGKSTLRIFDMMGRMVNGTNLTSTISNINIETLSNGVYTIQIADENNAVIARSKFTVSK